MRQLLCLALFVIPTLVLGDDAPVYHWSRQITLPDFRATTLAAVPLDSHFYHNTREGRPDVRLREEKGAAIGFVIRTASELKARSVRSTWVAQQTSAKVDAAIGLQVELVLRDKEPAPSGIRIVSPLRDFEHQVRIESSADGSTWVPAGPPTVIFDYSRHIDARNDRVAITHSEHRHFRITIQDITAEQESQLLELRRNLRGGEETDRSERTTIDRVPFRIDRIEFYRDDAKSETGKKQMTNYPVEHFKTTENAKDHQTIINFDSQREPITEIKIVTAVENFSRAANVEAEVDDLNGKATWRKLGSGTLTRFAIGSIQKEDLTLTIPETAAAHYRVLIENRDSPVLPITGVEPSGPLYELMFLASLGQSVKLEYGASDAIAGKFDTAALEAALAQAAPTVTATLQPPVANPNAGTQPDHVWKPWNDTRVLVGAICVATVLLGLGLFRASQRLTLPPDQ